VIFSGELIMNSKVIASIFTSLAAAGIFSAATAAEPAGQAGHASMTMATNQKSAPLAEGSIKKIDLAAGKVTIAHGPLVNLGMPAMTMAFKVKDAGWLKSYQIGDKIRFLAEQQDAQYVVVKIEKAT
jgi:Cu(I)/Ag(I) efflux system periplasmic protein CusF